jgi:hypothetical protein
MAFTIEVSKMAREEKFTLEDLKMVHQECLGGKINCFIYQSEQEHKMILECERCGLNREIPLTEERIISIIKLAIEGGKESFEQDIVMVQGGEDEKADNNNQESNTSAG